MPRQHFYGGEEAAMILQLTHVRTGSGCPAPAGSWGRTRERRSDCSGT
jgi:hypothetical protein